MVRSPLLLLLRRHAECCGALSFSLCKCICWWKSHCRCGAWYSGISHWWVNLQFGASMSENLIVWVNNITILCTSVVRSTLLQFRLVGSSGKNRGFSDLRDIWRVNASVERSLIVDVRHDISSFLIDDWTSNSELQCLKTWSFKFVILRFCARQRCEALSSSFGC